MLSKIILSFLLPLTATAGVISGGGGKSIVCRDVNGNITSAELLDLYEGRIMHGTVPHRSGGSMEMQIQRALQVIPASVRSWTQIYVDGVLKHMRVTPAGTELVPIDDSYEAVFPKGCQAEQLANYYNDKLILISGDIWAHLSTTDRAALVLHEAVYAANRLFGAKDSRHSRLVVAKLFDAATTWEDPFANVPTDPIACGPQWGRGGGFMFVSYKEPSGWWKLSFIVVGNSQVLSQKVTAPIYPFGEIDFEEAKEMPVIPGEDKIGTSTQAYVNLYSKFEDGDLLTLTKRWEAIKDNKGQIIPGFQTPKYYISWKSGTFPQTETVEQPINCTYQFYRP